MVQLLNTRGCLKTTSQQRVEAFRSFYSGSSGVCDEGATDWWILAFKPRPFHTITCQVPSRRSCWDFAVGSAAPGCGVAQQAQRRPQLHSRSSRLLQDLGFKETQCVFQTSHPGMPPTQRDATGKKTGEHFAPVVCGAPWWPQSLIHAGQEARKARERAGERRERLLLQRTQLIHQHPLIRGEPESHPLRLAPAFRPDSYDFPRFKRTRVRKTRPAGLS